MRQSKQCSFFRSIVITCMLSLIILSFSFSIAAQVPVLAKVAVNDTVESLDLDVFAHLETQDGLDYAFVIATKETLKTKGIMYEVLHDTSLKRAGMEYVLAFEIIEGTLDAASKVVEVLHNDGEQILVLANKSDVDYLAGIGLELRVLPMMPMTLETASSLNGVIDSNITYVDKIGDMINRVTQNTVSTYTGDLSGLNTIQIGGISYKMETRATGNKTWINRATQYTHDWLTSKGYASSYHSWKSTYYNGRNVIAEKKGKVKPNEIVLIVGHLDNVPSSGRAPGADDNASGSVGVMVAAEIMAPHDFERTVRFIHFTGEEQGLLGSGKYAQKCASIGENIVAVLNMDMIAYDVKGGPVARIHTRTTSSSGYQKDKALADTFLNVVKTYGLSSSLDAIIDADGKSSSDHASFWHQGYPAIQAIEDDTNDFNVNYHTVNDTLSNCNMKYYTAFVKACVGAAASYAIPVGSTPPNQLKLSVTIDGKGSVTLEPPGGTYKKGTQVTLRTTPDTGESFLGWSGDLSGTTNPATITMNAHKSVTAKFSGGGSAPDSCEGICGKKAPSGCWCDSSCQNYNDCCSDKVKWCGY